MIFEFVLFQFAFTLYTSPMLNDPLPELQREMQVASLQREFESAGSLIQQVRVESHQQMRTIRRVDSKPEHSHHVILASRPDTILAFTAEGAPDIWKEDYKQVWFGIHDSRFNRLEVKNRTLDEVTLDPEDLRIPLELLGSDSYLTAFGIWPSGMRRVPRLSDRYPFMLNDPAFWKTVYLKDETEVVDGKECLVLARNRLDRIWLDKEDPRIIRAREYCAAPNAILIERNEYHDHRDVQGFPFPFRINRQVFDTTTRLGEGSTAMPLYSIVIDVIDIQPGIEVDANAVLKAQDGLYVSDMETEQQINSGGQDLLVQHAEWARSRYLGDSGERRWPWRLLWTAAVGLVAGGLTLWGQRKLFENHGSDSQ